jgi:hypothetical protein
MVLWMVQLTQQPVYVWGCMSSPGKHVTSEESTDNGKKYTAEHFTMDIYTSSVTWSKLNFLKQANPKYWGKRHPHLRIKVVILCGGIFWTLG